MYAYPWGGNSDNETLAISNSNYLALIINVHVPKVIVEKFPNIRKKILWQNSRPKIKHKISSNTFETDGLKNVDIIKKL